MKPSIFLALVMLGTASSASAECLNFVNGRGPQRLGNFPLAATPTTLCTATVNKRSGPYIEVRLLDSKGDLAVAAAQLTSAGRCPGICKQLTLSSGNINGENVNLSGTQVVIKAETDHHLGIMTGVVSIQAGRDLPQQFLVIEAR